MTGWESIDAALMALGIRFGAPTAGQTTGGSHVAGSEHYDGRARDYGSADSDPAAIATALLPYATGPDAPIDELIYSPLGIFMDKGQPFTPTDEERQQHYGHAHVGVAPGVDLAAFVTGSPRATLTGFPGSGVLGDVVGGFLEPFRRVAISIVFVGAGVALLVMGGMRLVRRGEP